MAELTRKQQIEEMLRLDPEDQFLRYALAMEHVALGDDATAAWQFQELLVSAPNYIPAYLQAGQVLVRLDRAEEARRVLQSGIQAAAHAGDDHAASEMQALLMTLA
jgi:Tfp pilus assembly protein PilF